MINPQTTTCNWPTSTQGVGHTREKLWGLVNHWCSVIAVRCPQCQLQTTMTFEVIGSPCSSHYMTWISPHPVVVANSSRNLACQSEGGEPLESRPWRVPWAIWLRSGAFVGKYNHLVAGVVWTRLKMTVGSEVKASWSDTNSILFQQLTGGLSSEPAYSVVSSTV